MNITFSPVRRDDTLALSVSGDVLTINGEAFDFSAVPNGATLPKAAIACEWIVGDVERDGAGVLTVPLILPHKADAPAAARFPDPLIDVSDGEIDMSIYEPEPAPGPEEEEA